MERFNLLINNFDCLSNDLKVLSQQLKKENDELFNSIVENSFNLIAIVQHEKFVFINRAGLHLFKFKNSSEIIGTNIKETIDDSFKDIFSNKWSETDEPNKETFHIKFRCKDGSFFDCECNFVPFLYNKQPALMISGRDITHELHNQVRLNSEEKLRKDILNAFQEVVAFYSPEHKFVWLNNAGKKQLEIYDDSYIGKLCYKLWFNSNVPCKTCPVAMRKIESTERIITFHDNTIWMIRNIPLFDNKGILTGYIEFRSDITEKEKYRIELEKSHARQIRAELTNHFGHFELDLTSNNFILSPGTENILSLPLKKFRHYSENDFFKYVHPDDSKMINSYLKLVYKEDKKFDRIFKILDYNCIEKTIRGIGELKTDPVSGKKKFFAVIQDITRISNLEKQVFDEREKYKMLAENAPFGLILTKDNKPVYINKTLIDWYNLDLFSVFENDTFFNFFHPKDRETARIISLKIKENDIPSPVVEKLRVINKDGSIRHVRLELKNNIIHGQKYVQIVFTDITEDIIKEKKQKQIAADALYINQKNSILSEIETMLTKILNKKKFSRNQQDFEKIYEIINNYKQLDKDWKMLIANFEEVHPGFFSRLSKTYPELSPIDIKHCACIKMNMDTKEIARFFNIKVTSVQIGRVRIKKKMNLPESVDLRSHIIKF